MRKRGIALLAAVAALVTSMGLPVAAHAAEADGDMDIRILATSDLHGKFYPYDYAQAQQSDSGSLVQLASTIKELRTENTILVDCGDTIQDNSGELFLEDEIHPMILGMNEMGYDVWVLGNHEFNFGMDSLHRIMQEQKAAVLSGNVFNKDGSALAAGYRIIEKSGVKIGVIGMVTPNIVQWDGHNLKGCTVTDPVEETRKIISKIRDDVDILIAVEHMGEQNEYGVANSGVNDLANACPELDLIVAAHEHKAIAGKEVNGVLIVENASQAATVAQVDFTLHEADDGGYVIVKKTSSLVDISAYGPDKDLYDVLADYDIRAKEDAGTVIGKLTGGDLVEANEIPDIPRAQIEDSALVDLINDVQLHYSGADVAATALFSVNANLLKGDIKKSDTALIYKFANTLYKLEMTGAQLKRYMEWSAAYFNTYRDGDLTISFNPKMRAYDYDMFSGINYEINIAKEAGSRIENLTRSDGTPIADEDTLTIAVSDYRANLQLLSYGGIFKEGEELPKVVEIDVRGDIGGVRELLRDYIVNIKGGEISPETTQNWRITGNDWDEEMHRQAVELINAGKITLRSSEDGRTPCIRSVTVSDVEAAGGSATAPFPVVPVAVVVVLLAICALSLIKKK